MNAPDADLGNGSPSRVVLGGDRWWSREGPASSAGRPCGLLESLGAEVRAVRSAEHDLRDPGACRDAIDGADVVIHLAARVGGIGFNRRNPAPLATTT